MCNLTNYVTSEGNWLHQILFRGFIAKGTNTDAHTTFPFIFFFKFFETSNFFHFTSTIWPILCILSIAWNPNKNQFKLQVVKQQNRKNAKGDEYFCKELYVFLNPSVEDAWFHIKTAFLSILNKHAPFKKNRTKNRYSPWCTPDLTALDHKNILCVLH